MTPEEKAAAKVARQQRRAAYMEERERLEREMPEFRGHTDNGPGGEKMQVVFDAGYESLYVRIYSRESDRTWYIPLDSQGMAKLVAAAVGRYNHMVDELNKTVEQAINV